MAGERGSAAMEEGEGRLECLDAWDEERGGVGEVWFLEEREEDEEAQWCLSGW